jgi:hypothetical protein
LSSTIKALSLIPAPSFLLTFILVLAMFSRLQLDIE